MLCDNCGKREANVKYTENINGKVKTLNLCEQCSKELGLGFPDIELNNFSMPIDFSSFLGGFMEDLTSPAFMPMLNTIKELKCDNCGYTFDDIANTGKLGCEHCYDVFEEKLDPIIKRIQGANHHVGRTGKVIDNEIGEKFGQRAANSGTAAKDNLKNSATAGKSSKTASGAENESNEEKLQRLQADLKQAIKEENYEEAAKIRDEIKKINGDKK